MLIPHFHPHNYLREQYLPTKHNYVKCQLIDADLRLFLQISFATTEEEGDSESDEEELTLIAR